MASSQSAPAINTAHELGHKTDRLERWLAKVTLAPVAYGHFFVEHNRGHHVRVATPPDPASARYGESFWAFLPRTVLGSIASAWRLEKERLTRSGGSPWSWRNEVFHARAMTAVLWGATIAVFGKVVIPFLLIQALYGASLQALRHFEGAPQLPSGYATMILLAYVPPLWFRVMNPQVVAHYHGNMQHANIKPAIRERVLTEYSGAEMS